jgi:hypothetical protein
MRRIKIKRNKMLNFDEFEQFKLYESRTPESVYLKNKDIKSKDNKSLEEKDVQMIFNADPSSNKSYVNWLILLFKSTEKTIFLEDLYKATDYLTIYDKAKKNIEDERSKNIFNIKSLPELYDIIQPFKEDETKLLSKKQLRGDTPVEGQYEVIFSDENWDVIIPKTHASSCYWGSGTEWCTAVDANANYYNNYTKDGPLYIFRHKTDPKLRYQLHFESSQFKDVRDNEYSPAKFFNSYPYLKDVLSNYWSKHLDILNKSKKNPLSEVLNRGAEWDIFFKIIVDSGFDLNSEDAKSNSILINLCLKLNRDLVEFSCLKGADPKKTNNQGLTPVMAAVTTTLNSLSSKMSPTELDLMTLAVIEILFKYGADASGINVSGAHSTVSEAVLQNKTKTALFLVDKPGYDVNASDNKYDSGRNLALYFPGMNVTSDGSNNSFNYKEAQYLIETLIQNGLDVDRTSKTNFSNSPLHLLAHFAGLRSSNKEQVNTLLFMAKILLEHGADPWLKDNSISMNDKISGMNNAIKENLLPIQKPIGKPKSPEMVALLTEYMKKSKPGEKIPAVDVIVA